MMRFMLNVSIISGFFMQLFSKGSLALALASASIFACSANCARSRSSLHACISASTLAFACPFTCSDIVHILRLSGIECLTKVDKKQNKITDWAYSDHPSIALWMPLPCQPSVIPMFHKPLCAAHTPSMQQCVRYKGKQPPN